MKRFCSSCFINAAVLIPTLTFAAAEDLELVVAKLSMDAVIWASLILLGLIGIAAVTKSRSSILFGLIVLIVLGTSTLLIGSTIYLNQVSSSKGPVHWHADTEVWACGKELDYEDPKGSFSNKIGTPTLHEHNDKRIHLEGVVVNREDASLGKFFRVIGGEISNNSLVVPTTEGKKSFVSGNFCNDKRSQVQVFAYRMAENQTYTLTKLTDPSAYIIAPYSQVPQGDCIVIEFDVLKNTTDKMCRSWKVAMELGKVKERVQ